LHPGQVRSRADQAAQHVPEDQENVASTLRLQGGMVARVQSHHLAYAKCLSRQKLTHAHILVENLDLSTVQHHHEVATVSFFHYRDVRQQKPPIQ